MWWYVRFAGDFDTIEECKEAFKKSGETFFQVWDSHSGEVVDGDYAKPDKQDIYGVKSDIFDEYIIQPQKHLEKVFKIKD